MRIQWQIDADDISKVRDFFELNKDDAFVRQRIARNLSAEKSAIPKAIFWERMTGCLLTTQQRSGPNSPISRFMTRPFALDYEICRNQNDLAEFTRTTLSSFGGIRRSTTIGAQLTANMSYLDQGGWEQVISHLDELRMTQNRETRAPCCGVLG